MTLIRYLDKCLNTFSKFQISGMSGMRRASKSECRGVGRAGPASGCRALFHVHDGGHRLDAVPQVQEPDILVLRVLIIVVVGDGNGDSIGV
jgi:hypothetical protein